MEQQRQFNEINVNTRRRMYEDRIKIFNDQFNHSKNSSSSQRSSLESSKSIDVNPPHIYQAPLSAKAYESMTNITPKNSLTPIKGANSREKMPSKPRIPIIRDKSAPNTSHLDSSLSRRTTTVGQVQSDVDKAKLKSSEDRYKRNLKKRGGKKTTLVEAYV